MAFIGSPGGAVRVTGLGEAIIPFATCVVSVMLTMLPYGLSSNLVVAPAFAFMAIYYWTLFRPNLMHPIMIFFVGLYQDLLSMGPLGLWATTYLLLYAYWLLRREYFTGRSFASLWFSFGISVVILMLVSWIITSIFFTQFVSPRAVIIQGLFTFFLYPLYARFLAYFNRRISRHM